MAADNKRVLIVVAPRQFRDEELTEPIKYFEKYDIGFDIVSTMTGLAVGMLGGKVLIENTISDVLKSGIDLYDGVVIVGGGGAIEHLWSDRSLQTLTREFDKKGKIIAAICLSPVVLSRAGLLNQKEATVWNDDNAISELKEGGAIFKSQPIVTDGRIITANGPSAAAGFGEKISKAILG